MDKRKAQSLIEEIHMNTVYPTKVGWRRGSDISLREGYRALL